jgi:hypothetical protein
VTTDSPVLSTSPHIIQIRVCRINSRGSRFESRLWHPNVLTYFSSALLMNVTAVPTFMPEFPPPPKSLYLTISSSHWTLSSSYRAEPSNRSSRACSALRATAPCHHRHYPGIRSQNTVQWPRMRAPLDKTQQEWPWLVARSGGRAMNFAQSMCTCCLFAAWLVINRQGERKLPFQNWNVRYRMVFGTAICV